MDQQSLTSKLQYKVPQFKLALIHEETKYPGRLTAIKSPKDVYKFAQPLKHYPDEHCIAFHLNARSEVIGMHEVSHGTISASLVHPREVFKAALLSNAFAIVIAHNHPGLSLTASKEDLDITQQLIAAGQILGVSVVDHLIVSAKGFASIREDHPHLWSDNKQHSFCGN